MRPLCPAPDMRRCTGAGARSLPEATSSVRPQPAGRRPPRHLGGRLSATAGLDKGPPSSGRDPALQDFTEFAIRSKIEFQQVRPDAIGGVRGIYATFPVFPGDTLIRVPRESAITVQAGGEPSPSAAVPDATWAQLPWYGQMAVKLCMAAADGRSSPLREFVAVLPREPVDLPALWGKSDVEALRYPYLQATIAQEREQWAGMSSVLAAPLRAMGSSHEAFVWALTCVRSRTFAGPAFPSPFRFKLYLLGVLQAVVASQTATGAPTWLLAAAEAAAVAAPAAWAASDQRAAETAVQYAMAPFIDFINHDSRVSAECQYDWLRDAYRVVADRQYSPGQQVYINYGDQSNDQLLQVYGFVESDNPRDRYVMTRLADHLAADSGPLSRALGAEAVRRALSTESAALAAAVIDVHGEFVEDVVAAVTRAAGAAGADAGVLAELVGAALADAVHAEMEARGCSRAEDEARLRELLAKVELARNPPPPPPPPLQPGGEPVEHLDDGRELNGGGGSLDAAGPDALGSEEETMESSLGGGATEAGMQAAMDPAEAQALLQSFPRQQSVLKFRIEKAAVLERCAQQLLCV